MDDIFEEHQRVEEDQEQLPEMLPDLPEDLENEVQATQRDEEAENKEVLAKLQGMSGASKNTVKRPMPKLDSIRLTGERGIPVLPHVFKDVKLKGKGHEVEDIRVVMRYLEHWAHRLFPMMPFDEVLERIERLGTKRDVQTCIKKMRLDMPVLGSDFVSGGGDEDSGHVDEGTNNSTEKKLLSDDVLERIERNRRLAMERRAQKQSVPSSGNSNEMGDSSPQPSTSRSPNSAADSQSFKVTE